MNRLKNLTEETVITDLKEALSRGTETLKAIKTSQFLTEENLKIIGEHIVPILGEAKTYKVLELLNTPSGIKKLKKLIISAGFFSGEILEETGIIYFLLKVVNSLDRGKGEEYKVDLNKIYDIIEFLTTVKGPRTFKEVKNLVKLIYKILEVEYTFKDEVNLIKLILGLKKTSILKRARKYELDLQVADLL
jgi:hypothetical protein